MILLVRTWNLWIVNLRFLWTPQ